MFIHLIILFTLLTLINGDVVELTPTTFDTLVKGTKQVWVVQFYSPNCLFCEKFAPEYEKTAKKLATMDAKAGRIDAVQYDKFSEKYDVRGYPTLKIFGANKDAPQDYHGPRTSEDIVNSVSNIQQNKKARSGYGMGWEFLTHDVEPQCMKKPKGEPHEQH